MRSSLLTLVGFTAFVLCPATCPMGAEVASAKTVMQHDMHADAGDMHHDHEEAPCEHCETNVEVELALNNGGNIAIEMPVSLFAFVAFGGNTSVEYANVKIPKSHLAGIGPPVVPNIVSTVVLRT